MPAPRRAFYPPPGLKTLGLLSLLLYGLVAGVLRASNALADVLLFLALFAGLFLLLALAHRRAAALPRSRRVLAEILVFAGLFRLVMAFAGLPAGDAPAALARDLAGREPGYGTFLLYDNDVWRFLWDGHVTASGGNPYAETPRQIADRVGSAPADAPPLESELWWDVLDNVSFQDYTTVYPPAAQLFFRAAHALAPGSVFVFKLLLGALDLGTCLLLASLLGAVGRPRREVVLYAWNPLAIKELAGSGHADALMIFLLTAALLALVRWRHAAAHLLLGLAVASKLAAAVLLPLFWRRTRPLSWLAAPAAAAVVSLPFLGHLARLGEGLAAYGREWVFNSGPWLALSRLFAAAGAENPGLWAHLVTKAALLALLAAALRHDGGDERRWLGGAFLVLAALVVLHPAVMPWYVLWPLPLAIAVGNRAWLWLTGLSLLSYLFYVEQAELSWWLWLEYGLFFAVVLAETVRPRGGGANSPSRDR